MAVCSDTTVSAAFRSKRPLGIRASAVCVDKLVSRLATALFPVTKFTVRWKAMSSLLKVATSSRAAVIASS